MVTTMAVLPSFWHFGDRTNVHVGRQVGGGDHGSGLVTCWSLLDTDIAAAMVILCVLRGSRAVELVDSRRTSTVRTSTVDPSTSA